MSAAILFAVLCMGAASMPEGMGGQTFQAWVGFGAGSSSTFESTAANSKDTLASTTEMKLIERADDHLLLEVSSTVVLNGQSHAMPPMKITIRATPDPAIKITQIGTEDVAAAGKTFSCKIYSVDHPEGDEKATLKIWTCGDVPGGIVKMEIPPHWPATWAV